MTPYRDYNGLWKIDGYEEVGSFTSESDAKTAITLARAVSSCDQMVEYFNRMAAARGQQKVAEVAQ